jgi:hypothetical protein
MSEKPVGTNDVTVIVCCASWEDANKFIIQFATSRAIQIVDLKFDTEPDVPDSGWAVMLRFTNTCKNRGNHYSDARRFAQRALRGVNGELDDLEFHGWTPA